MQDGDGCLSEEEFIGLFQKARSGQLGDNQGLQRALHKICSSVPAVRTVTGGGAAAYLSAKDGVSKQVLFARRSMLDEESLETILLTRRRSVGFRVSK